MPRIAVRSAVLGLCAPIVALSALEARAVPLASSLVASGLTQPLYVTHAVGDFSRVFIIEKPGRIRLVKNGVLLAGNYLDMTSIVNSSNLEWGLLGMCFHPNYRTNGVFYVNYSDAGGNSVIASFRAIGDPAMADTADFLSRQTILFLAQPNSNHRGGWLDFEGGYLYASFGDGGGQNDPSNRAQNLSLLQGKILRLDVDGADNIPGNGDDDAFGADPNKNYSIPPANPFAGGGGAAEIWAYGLRNPWRCSFDRLTRDLYIGDVGQNQREEIDFQPAASAGGQNYGWRCTEGTFCTGFTGCTCNGPTLTPPIHEYNHVVGVSITGGYVYRGCAIPDLVGTYMFAEFQFRKMFSFTYDGVSVSNFMDRTVELAPPGGGLYWPASFGEDAYGEILWCDYGGAAGGAGTGRVFRIVPASFVGPDCNANARRDACDVLDGSAFDDNANGVLDECCPGDINGDGMVGAPDLASLLGAWATFFRLADLDGSGGVGSPDLALLLGGWGPCP